MVLTEIMETEHGAAIGMKIAIGDAKTPLMIIRAERGYLASEYLNRDYAEKEGDAACIICGVRSFQDMLGKRVSWVSPKARELGVRSTMKGIEALDLMV